MNQTPNEELRPQKFIIGKWEASPFTLQTAILLEKTGSPFMQMKLDKDGNPEAVVPTINDVAEALYIILNWDKPWINEIVADSLRFANEVGQIASQITMREFAVITGQLNSMMAALNTAVTESGIPAGDQKKDGTGPSA